MSNLRYLLIFFIGPSFILGLAVFIRFNGFSSASLHCRSWPYDQSWPHVADWDSLNQTVEGRLIANVPIASACHGSSTNEQECNNLRKRWFFSSTHIDSPSSLMAYQFTNDSCNPFTSPESPCTLKGQAVYTVNASRIEHIQAAVKFAKARNVRLVIRNTAHDYLGKSTGSFALAIWTRHIDSLDFIPDYNGKNNDYDGPAIRLDAGVEIGEAYSFAERNEFLVVGGICPTVALAGGYVQGGGHGPVTSSYGAAADQVLEFTAITADGNLVTASPEENSNLFWALRGGGGGTYAVVVSTTIRALPNTYVSSATFTVVGTAENTDAINEALKALLTNALALTDAGVTITWVMGPFGLLLSPAYAPDMRKDTLDQLLRPTIDRMNELGLQHSYSSIEHPSFLPAYEYNTRSNTWNVSDLMLGGRLIPRDLVKKDVNAVVDAARYACRYICSGVTYSMNRGYVQDGFSRHRATAVNPFMREALINLVAGVPISYDNQTATELAQRELTNDLVKRLKTLVPVGGSYLSEGDAFDPDWKSAFYGSNYEELRAVKRVYDPNGLFYAKTAVGSEDWAENADGRLCRV